MNLPAGALLSPHLSWAEATTTAQDRDPDILAAQSDPPALVRANLLRTAVDLFEPIRELVGPMRVTSGYRCAKLNALIGGAKTSKHMDGLALDVIPVRMALRDAYLRIQRAALPIDQLIFELGRWIHVGGAPHGVEPRRQFLMMLSPGQYEAFNAADPRVRGVEAT